MHPILSGAPRFPFLPGSAPLALLIVGLLLPVGPASALPYGRDAAGAAGEPPLPTAAASFSQEVGEAGSAPRATAQGLLAWSPATSWYQIGEGAGMASVPAYGGSSSAVLFGGTTSGLVNTTSLYNESSNAWTAIHVAGPSPRTHFAFAGDPLLDLAVLFGGVTNATSLGTDNQTWEFRMGNDTWHELPSSTAPAPRADSAFALAPYVGTALLFGGWNQSYGGGEIIYSDTWTLDLASGSWTHVTLGGAGTHPPSLHGASLLWDPVIHRFELFGGCDPCSNALWRYDPWNQTWTSVVTSATQPAARGNGVWAFDPAQGLDVLFGGDGTSGALADAWTFDPTTQSWTAVAASPTPSARYASAATWLTTPLNQTLLVAGGNTGFGPLNDLWRFAPTSEVDVRLLDAVTHAPLDLGTVTLDSVFQTSTDANGYGNTTQVAPGSTIIMGTKVGYHPTNASLWLRPGLTPPLVIMNLTPNPHANLTVQVDGASGAPLSGVYANVTVGGVPWRAPPLQTNSLGFAYYTGLPANVTFLLTTWRQGYHENRSVLSLLPDQNLTVSITLWTLPHLVFRALGADISLPGAAYPFPGAMLLLNGSAYGLTGASGFANLTFNRSGPLATEATFANCANGYDNISMPYSGTAQANPTLVPEEASGIDARVLDNTTGSPIAFADVNDSYSNGLQFASFLTGSLGYSNSSLLRSGPNHLQFWAPGYYEKDLVVFLDPGLTFHLNVSLVPLPVLRLHVSELDVHNRTVAVPGASVYWNGLLSGTTGQGGWLNFTPARAGSVRLTVTLRDYRSGYENLTLNQSGTRWVNLTLVHAPWAVLEVQTLDRDNDQPIVSASITALMPDLTSNLTTSGANGFGNMTTIAGTATGTAVALNYYSATGTVYLTAYRPTELRLFLVPYPVVHLHVLGHNATSTPAPLAGATVTFNGTFVGFTGPTGWLNVSSYPGGAESVVVSDPLYFPGLQLAHLPYTGSLNLTFDLSQRPLSSVDVRVYDSFTGLVAPLASVNLTNTDPLPTTQGSIELTLRSGWANFTNLGYGNYTITAYHSGYSTSPLPTQYLHPLGWGAFRIVTLYLNPLPYCYAFFEVRDRNTSAPISGAEVLIDFAYAGYTNAQGTVSFPLPELPGGDYEVVASAQGYYDWQSPFPYVFPSGRHFALNITLLPAPKVNCTSPSMPGCHQTNSGQYTRGNFSILPFASGPWWPFLVLPPIFLLGALAYFLLTRRRNGSSAPPRPVPPPLGPPLP